MEKYRKIISKITITLLVSVLLLVTIGTIHAKDKKDKLTETVTARYHPGWEDPHMAGIAAHAGQSLVAHLEKAKDQLDKGKTDNARQTIQRCGDIVDGLMEMIPFLSVADDIKDTKSKAEVEGIDTLSTHWLPIYASLSEMSVYAPKVAQNAKEGVKKAEEHTKQGKKKEAAQTLENVADGIIESTVYLPVDFVESQVATALNALFQYPANVNAAKTAVNHALESLTVVVDAAAVVK